MAAGNVKGALNDWLLILDTGLPDADGDCDQRDGRRRSRRPRVPPGATERDAAKLLDDPRAEAGHRYLAHSALAKIVCRREDWGACLERLDRAAHMPTRRNGRCLSATGAGFCGAGGSRLPRGSGWRRRWKPRRTTARCTARRWSRRPRRCWRRATRRGGQGDRRGGSHGHRSRDAGAGRGENGAGVGRRSGGFFAGGRGRVGGRRRVLLQIELGKIALADGRRDEARACFEDAYANTDDAALRQWLVISLGEIADGTAFN